ncbi:MarR family transcriptional regulator [Paenibacillus spiritus]|uniref:MarR family transcriptional regulator n=1 Tax=Paenibacillus spiritus TaxID=2496557 RepID=A0A5J5FUU6_9BACL|nr:MULTISPECIES: MarR family transcriptional regulator [Paenibacillus]KAA8997137.1 MarR family transcriptional regulator [Paenibacillus spiritus]
MNGVEENTQLEEIMTSFRRLSHVFHQLLSRGAEQCNITGTQLTVLRKVSQHPEIRISELAELMHQGNSAVSGVVERMVKSGWLTRVRSEEDRRICRLALTEEGERIMEQAHVLFQHHVDSLDRLSDEDVQTLLRIHEDMIQILEQRRESNEL